MAKIGSNSNSPDTSIHAETQPADSLLSTNSSAASPPKPFEPIIVQARCPKKFTVEELAGFISTLLQTVENLQKQNCALVEKVGNLESQISGLSDAIKSTSVNTKKSFAEVVSKQFASPTTQVSMMRAAELAQHTDSRKSAVILRNVDISSDSAGDVEFGNKIADECNTGSCSVFRIPLKEKLPPLIKLQLENKEDAFKVLSSFEKAKLRINGCRNATVRPDFTKPELLKYREAWKQAIKLNNEKKLRIYTVRNLEVVKIQYKDGQTPWEWTVRQGK